MSDNWVPEPPPPFVEACPPLGRVRPLHRDGSMRVGVTRWRWTVAVVVFLASACGAPGSEDSGDSEESGPWQGEVIRIPAEALEALEPTSPDPVLTIDGNDESRGPPLSYIADVARTAEGHVLILEGLDQVVHMFGPGGEFLRTIGGRGEGPGEFSRASSLAVSGDTLAVWEWDSRLHLFSLEGAHLRTDRIESGGPGPRWTGLTAFEGTAAGILATRSEVSPSAAGPVPDSELKPYRETILLQRLRLEDAQLDSVLTFPGRYFAIVRQSGNAFEIFGPASPFAISADGEVVRVPGGEFAIEWLDDAGVVARTVVSDLPPRPVLDAEVDRLIDLSLSLLPPELEEEFGELMQDSPVASHHPAIFQLLADASGRVLAHRSDIGPVVEINAHILTGQSSTDLTWDYLSRDGELLGRFLIPPTDRPVLLRDGYLHAIRTSPLGVPSLVVYDLLGAGR